MNYYTFKVTGNYDFPLDMLRYDACFPRTGDDAACIGYDAADYRSARLAGVPIEITLCHHDTRVFWEPTEARWSSFGWVVSEITNHGKVSDR